MKRPRLRSRGVNEAATATLRKAPANADLAFDALYREHRDDVYAYVMGLLRDSHAAEDATALAFERAYRKRRRFDPERGSGRAWIFGIARNAALDELRGRKRRARIDADPEDVAAEPVADDAERAMRRAALAQALTALGTRDRELIALRFFGALSHTEIADVMGISPSNAGTRLHRAIAELRRHFDENA